MKRLIVVLTMLLTIFCGCKQTVESGNSPSTNEIPLERKIYLLSRESIRRRLVNPTDAFFYEKWNSIVEVKNNGIVSDKLDTNVVAKSYCVDYWISEGQVDAYAKIGGKERIYWMIVSEYTNEINTVVYSLFGKEESGVLPTMDKGQAEEIKKQQEKIQADVEELEKMQQRDKVERESAANSEFNSLWSSRLQELKNKKGITQKNINQSFIATKLFIEKKYNVRFTSKNMPPEN